MKRDKPNLKVNKLIEDTHLKKLKRGKDTKFRVEQAQEIVNSEVEDKKRHDNKLNSNNQYR